jgi:hypothetical protein
MLNLPCNKRLKLFALAVIMLPLAACDPSKGTLNQMGWSPNGPPGISSNALPGSPFNGKDYADPHPQSESNDAQRAAFEQNQREQREMSTGPDLSKMTCAGIGTPVQSANSGSLNSITSCHN